MSRAFPKEFRDEVVAVARKREASLLQIAKDFGISDATLHNWLKAADKGRRGWPEWGYDFWIIKWVPFSRRDRGAGDVMFELAGNVA